MLYNYLSTVYSSLKNLNPSNNSGHLKTIISDNERLLNGFTCSVMFGGSLEAAQEAINKDILNAIQDLITRCGDPKDIDKVIKLINSLVQYINILYITVRNVDLVTIQSQFKELEDMIRSHFNPGPKG